MNEQCANCTYYVANGPNPNDLKAPPSGVCRRYPPVLLVALPQGQIWSMPGVQAKGWCGEYKTALVKPGANNGA